MDGGVEKYGERMAGNWWQTKTTPLLLPFVPLPPAHNGYTDTHPSILPPDDVEGQDRVKPAGRGRKPSPPRPRVRLEGRLNDFQGDAPVKQ